MHVRTLAGEKSKHRKALNLPQATTSLIPPMLLTKLYNTSTIRAQMNLVAFCFWVDWAVTLSAF